jgi:hypothetical protein
LKKADLVAVAHYLIGHLSYSQVPALAKRHKVEAKKDSASAQELLASKWDRMRSPNSASFFWKSACWIRLISDPPTSRNDVLMDAAKRCRVDAEKLQKAVAKEFAAKRDKKTVKPKAHRTEA